MSKLFANGGRFGGLRPWPQSWSVKRLAADQSGVTAVEYGLMVAAIATAILAMTNVLNSGFAELAKNLVNALTL